MNGNFQIQSIALLAVTFEAIGKKNEAEELRNMLKSLVDIQKLTPQIKQLSMRTSVNEPVSSMRRELRNAEKSLANSIAIFNAYSNFNLVSINDIDEVMEWANRLIQNNIK